MCRGISFNSHKYFIWANYDSFKQSLIPSFSQKIIVFMEENIPYRRLRSLKHKGVGTTSQRLLRPIYRNRSQEKHGKTIMSQNVTEYLYMIKDSQIKQNYIKWATNLRQHDEMKIKHNNENSQNQVPAVFYKSTKCQKQREAKTKSYHVNTAEFSQFFGKDSINLPQKSVAFLSELRNIQLKENKMNQSLHDTKFYNYGGQQKTILPRILKKCAIKKLRNIQPSDYEQSLDGTNQYPQYSYKILRQKNSSLIDALTSIKSGISLPGIAWTVGLRSY